MKFNLILISCFISTGLAYTEIEEPCTGNVKIIDSSELGSIIDCKKYKGDITITDSYTGEVSLPNLETLTGSLIIDAAKVSSISLESLQRVSNRLVFKTIDTINSIQISALASVSDLEISEVGNDHEIIFQPGLKLINKLTIQDTRINKLQNIHASTINEINIRGNPELEILEFDNLVRSLGNVYFIGSRKAKFNAPKMTTVQGELQFIDIHSFNLPILEAINGQLLVTRARESKVDLPKLRIATGGMVVNENKPLKQLVFPNLKSLAGGDLKIHDNPSLELVNFTNLLEVGGFEIISATVSNLTINNQIRGRGAINVKTPINCSQINKLIGINFPQGTCTVIEKQTPSKSIEDTSSAFTPLYSALSLILIGFITML